LTAGRRWSRSEAVAESEVYISPIVAALFELVADYGLKSARLRELALETNRSFAEEHGGAAQFAAITDPALRAVVSDEVTRSAAALLENLVMAAFHRSRLLEIAGAGVPRPEGQDVDALKLQLAVRAEVISTVGSLWNTLDCLASCATVVLRVPMAIQDATFAGLERVLAERVGKRQGGRRHLEAWAEFLSLIGQHRTSEPHGWFEWLSGMRNAVVHRPELLPVWLQRRPDRGTPPLEVVAASPPRSLAFDLHLRRRPDATDMEMYLDAVRPEDVLLGEPAERTLAGMIFLVNALLEDSAALLVRWWRESAETPSDFRPPKSAWKLRAPTTGEFRGIAPDASGFEGYAGAEVNDPTMLVRVQVAERVRRGSTLS
jgi:hypothetical protein